MTFFPKWRIRRRAEDAETAYVSERFGVRSLHIGSDTVQSAMRIAKPIDLELAYTRSMMAFLLFNPHPSRVLLVGLGGGSLAKFIYHRLPDTVIEAVEISPQVVAIAKHYFQLPAEDSRFRIVVGDGAEHVARPGSDFDVIAVDGYDAESLVEALSQSAFYRDCRARLSQGGILVVNLWGGDRQFDENLKRIEESFPAGTLCLPAEKPGNIIVFAFRDAPAEQPWDELDQRARELEAAVALEFPRFVKGLRKMNRHDDRCLLI